MDVAREGKLHDSLWEGQETNIISGTGSVCACSPCDPLFQGAHLPSKKKINMTRSHSSAETREYNVFCALKTAISNWGQEVGPHRIPL